MENKVLKAPNVTDEIISVIRSNLDKDELIERLNDYHENDIAQSLEYLTKQERLSLYDILGDEWVSDILAYVEEPEQYIDELGVKKLADIINEMDSDDAADLLEKYNLPFDVMLPLIDETARKVHELAPRDAQTGPAVRYDENVMSNHLAMLVDSPALQEIYKLMSKSIHEHHKL